MDGWKISSNYINMYVNNLNSQKMFEQFRWKIVIYFYFNLVCCG